MGKTHTKRHAVLQVPFPALHVISTGTSFAQRSARATHRICPWTLNVLFHNATHRLVAFFLYSYLSTAHSTATNGEPPRIPVVVPAWPGFLTEKVTQVVGKCTGPSNSRETPEPFAADTNKPFPQTTKTSCCRTILDLPKKKDWPFLLRQQGDRRQQNMPPSSLLSSPLRR